MKTYTATYIKNTMADGEREITKTIQAKTLASATKKAMELEFSKVYGYQVMTKIELAD